MTAAHTLPFSAIVGLNEARRALLLLAVDAGLKGLLVASGPGSGKSTLIRSLPGVISSRERDRLPFIELPVGVTDDRLFGGLDFESALATGEPRFTTGLLTAADGGFLYVDEINLLDPGAAASIAAALDSGIVRIERDGVSVSRRSDFMLLGTFDPSEGAVSPLLEDRVALIASAHAVLSPKRRAEIVERVDRLDRDRDASYKYRRSDASIVERIEKARARLKKVKTSRSDVARLCQVSTMLGVTSNRADVFALRAARANAALEGRRSITQEDLACAIRLVLAPRANREAPPQQEQPQRQEVAGSAGSVEDRDESSSIPDEILAPPADASLPDSVMDDGDRSTARAGKSRRNSSGRKGHERRVSHGRHVRDVQESEGKRVSVAATIRAAAPFQRERNAGELDSGRIRIAPEDLRYKQLKRRSGLLFILVVDASGSMAVGRMAEAKGALISLLGKAYLRRDLVALIRFRGESADVLLEPTSSVELARRVVDRLPSGGGTPLPAALVSVLSLVRRARLRCPQRPAMLLFTDGRANVGLRPVAGATREARGAAVNREIKQLGAALAAEGVSSMVIDTSSQFVSGGEARSLAAALGAGYTRLPQGRSGRGFDAIAGAASQLRAKLSDDNG